MKYRLAPLAKADLDEIWSYVAQNGSLATADRFVDRITKYFPRLARNAAMGRPRPDIGSGIRSFAVGKYLIYYAKGRRGGIVIARVFHGMREQGPLL